jgi:hypothetical protein
MTALFLISVTFNIYLFITLRNRNRVNNSLRGSDSINQATIIQLQNEIRAGRKLAERRKANKPVVEKKQQRFFGNPSI